MTTLLLAALFQLASQLHGFFFEANNRLDVRMASEDSYALDSDSGTSLPEPAMKADS